MHVMQCHNKAFFTQFFFFFCIQVEAILVNIFGGIVNCAIIANGITKACRELELKVPLVVRLEGTNVQEAKRILSESGLPITSATDLDDAAKKAVAAISKN
ncbi:succinate--CoA ligase [GDP-forming] subunit beta, mitochondrial-like [Carassius auratus]|uniref:Succinate--CoA ligase [GDP-forming] subunit beta, mitochondrial-like n=1 Tax=Carassius auratus TaxID=7957 RepID=A0A6P6NFQ2_CARAU|nr:succinate--CoA ligase [GDP-forming] subunit beta, mitochondrial-like [Carassius auratus]